MEEYFYKISILTDEELKVVKSWSRLSPESMQKQHMEFLNDFLTYQNCAQHYQQSGKKDQKIDLFLHAMECNVLENLHSFHENSAIPILSALAQSDLSILDNPEHMIDFMAFLGHQISRTKTFKDTSLGGLARNTDLEKFAAKATEKGWWFISYMLGMNLGASLFLSRNRDRHSLLINESETPFITSDQPIVNIHPCVDELRYVQPKYADFFYPISPRIGYFIGNSNRFKNGKSHITRSTAEEINTKIARQGKTHIFGNSEAVVRTFASHIGGRYQK
jgi:hypothetical protein